MPGVTLDAGGLIALDRDDRRVVVEAAPAAQRSGDETRGSVDRRLTSSTKT